MRGSEPDEDGQVQLEVGNDLLERRLADLQAGQVVRALADAPDHVDGDRVSAARGEGIDEEGERRARGGGGYQVLGQRRRVEREVRRRDHRHCVSADLRGVGRQVDGVGGGLRASVDDEHAPDRRPKDDCGALALVQGEEDPLAGRAAGECAVRSVVLAEADHWPYRGLVEAAAALAQWRRDGHDEGCAVELHGGQG